MLLKCPTTQTNSDAMKRSTVPWIALFLKKFWEKVKCGKVVVMFHCFVLAIEQLSSNHEVPEVPSQPSSMKRLFQGS